MAFEYSLFENPEVFALVLGVLIFILVFYIMAKMTGNRGASIVIGFSIGGIVGWTLYNERFYGWENTLGVLLYIVIIGIFLKIIWAFLKSIRRSVGR